jgi:DNA helicase HerA-like ATPase
MTESNGSKKIKATKKSTANNILSTPEEAFKAIDEDSERAGGPWTPPAGYEGSIGRTMFDTPASKDGSVTVLMPNENIDTLPNQALVRIKSVIDARTYLGAVIEGPFAEPDGLRADATPMVISIVQGGLLMPKYHGRVQVEIIGERLEEGAVVPPRRRPKPNSPVFALNAAETAEVLRIMGNMRVGLADGFDDLEVCIQSDSKSVFPRHLGILGTTGGGKSTTVSGLLLKAQTQNMAIIIIDIEGEYCAINEPTQDSTMQQVLSRIGQQAAGVNDTHVYHLTGRDTRNPSHPSRTSFSLRFSELSPYAVQEILELNDAQSERFSKAYEITKLAMERFRIWPRNAQERAQLLELDELETGYPEMRLDHLYDVVAQIAAMKNNDPDPNLVTTEFSANRDDLKNIINASQAQSHGPSWRKVQGRLGQIRRLRIFDSNQARPINYGDMLQPGRISIIDLSDTDSPHVRNLVIAELLRGIQNQQDVNYLAAVSEGRQPTPTTIFIEEAHEFLSAHRIRQMEVLFQQVARIARRGRKRWLGLVFITQMPQHLPDEVLGLINNWVLHKITDANVISRLKRSIGGINEGLWRHLPSLAPGQAIISFTTQARPLLITVDPTPCRLLMVE